MPSFLWGSQKGPFSGAFLKGFDYQVLASPIYCPWTVNEPTQPRPLNEIALIGWLWLIDRDCLCPDFGGNIVGDQ